MLSRKHFVPGNQGDLVELDQVLNQTSDPVSARRQLHDLGNKTGVVSVSLLLSCHVSVRFTNYIFKITNEYFTSSDYSSDVTIILFD